MTSGLTVKCDVDFRRRGRGSCKELIVRRVSQPVTSPGRIPRVARLMALAIRFERLIRTGALRNYAELAALGHVTRARVTQIMNLRQLAPDIQEQVLHLPPTQTGRDPIRLAQLQPIAIILDWRKQRRMWSELLGRREPGL
jgi:hypothetical protein